MGGAPSVYIGDGTCTNMHVDRRDFALPSSQGEQLCTVFSKFEYDGHPSRIVNAIQAYLSPVVHGCRVNSKESHESVGLVMQTTHFPGMTDVRMRMVLLLWTPCLAPRAPEAPPSPTNPHW